MLITVLKSRTHLLRMFVLGLVLTGCGGVAPSVPLPGTTPQQTGTTPNPTNPIGLGWQAFMSEHMALWYHSLAVVRAGASANTTGLVPIYRPGYADTVAAARRRLGAPATALERQASQFAQTFSDPAYGGLQFLPLYFQDAQNLFNTVRAWDQSQGDPQRAGSQQTAQGVAFLSSQFPREAQRRAVVDFTNAVQEEHTAFFSRYWQEQQPRLSQVISSFRSEWNVIQPTLRRFLEYAQLPSAEVFLVPALGGEGRTVTSGLPQPRFAVGTPATGEEVVFNVIHEVMYSIANDVIRDNVAPAEIRDAGEDVLSSRVAVRGGAVLLARLAPNRLNGYRRYYLQQVGRAVPGSAAAQETAFAQAFPLPDALRRGLEKEIESALAGI